MIINPEQIFELQNQVLNQANNSYDRLTNLIYFTVGTFLVIFTILGILQIRMSDNQIKKLKTDIESDMKEKYKLDVIGNLQKDFQFTRLEKALEDMSQNVSEKSYSLSVLYFGNALEYMDVSDENFVFSLLVGGHLTLISTGMLEDNDPTSGFRGKAHDNLWDKRINVLKKYDSILDRIEEEGTNKTGIWTIENCKEQIAELMIELHKKKKA